MHTTSDDAELVRAFVAGDEKAFEELVRRYQRQVANLIYLTMGDRSEVEDLSQEVFLRVYRSADRFGFDASFFSWLYRITVNVCIDELRRRKVKRAFSLESLRLGRGAEELESSTYRDGLGAVLQEEKESKVAEALRKISPDHRTVLILREYNDLSYAEIAKVLGISTQAVKSRIYRAREEMRNLLQDYFRERQ